MRREFPGRADKKWSVSPLRSHLTPELSVSIIVLSSLDSLAKVCARRPGDLAYVVIARVIDRSTVEHIERHDVNADALAGYLPLRDAATSPTDHQLADAALAWIRSAVTAALGDRETTKIKVTIWGPKGQEQLVSKRVTVSRAAAPVTVDPAAAVVIAAGTGQRRGRVNTFLSSNGPTWRAMIEEADAARQPVSELVRGAAHVAEQAERAGVPQLPVSREIMEALRQHPERTAVSALRAADQQPSVFARDGGQFVRLGRASVQRQEAAESELERVLYRTVGRGLIGVVQAAVEVSSAAVSVVSGVAGVVADAR